MKSVIIFEMSYFNAKQVQLVPIFSFFTVLSSVDSAVRSVDNTLTIIIASAVGGAIALLMGYMLLKNFTLFVLSKLAEKK